MIMIRTEEYDYDIELLEEGRVKVIEYYLDTGSISDEIISNNSNWRSHLKGKIIEEKGRLETGGVLYAKAKNTILMRNEWTVNPDTWYEVLYEDEMYIKFVSNLGNTRKYFKSEFDFKYIKEGGN